MVASAGHETGPGSWAAAGLEKAVAAAVGNQAEIGFFKGAFFFVKDQVFIVFFGVVDAYLRNLDR